MNEITYYIFSDFFLVTTGFFIYKTLVSERFILKHYLIDVIVFLSVNLLTFNFIENRFRVLLAKFAIIFVYWCIKSKIHVSLCLFLFTSLAFLRILAQLIGIVLFEQIDTSNIAFYYFTLPLIIEILLFALLYLLCRRFRGFFDHNQKESEYESFILSITVIFFTLHFVASLSFIAIELEQLLRAEMLWALLLVSLSLLTLGIIVMKYMINERSKRIDQERKTAEISHSLQEIVASHNRYRKQVPNLLASFQGLVNEVEHILKGNATKNLVRVENYINLIHELSLTTDIETYEDKIESIVEDLVLPNDWNDLKLSLSLLVNEAKQVPISILMQNRFKDWETLPIKKLDVMVVIEDLFSNHITELKQSSTEKKKLMIQFTNLEGKLVVEMRSNADIISINCFKKMSGLIDQCCSHCENYTAWWLIVKKTNASVIFKEWMTYHHPMKSVAIIFDEKSKIILKSQYRKEKLQKALENSTIQVEYYYF